MPNLLHTPLARLTFHGTWMALVLLFGSGHALASAKTNVAVDYEADPQAHCPSAEQVAATVQREGVNVTVSSEAALWAKLKVDRDALGLHALIAINESTGGEQAVRQIDGAHDRCVDLVRVFAVLVALQVQKQINPVANTPSAPRRASSSPRAVAKKTVPATPKTEPVVPVQPTAVLVEPMPATVQSTPASRPALAVWGGPLVDAALTATRVGGLLGVAVGIAHHWRAVVEPYAAWGHNDVEAGAFDSSVLGGALSACWLPWMDRRVTLWLCPEAAMEVMFVRGVDVDVPQNDATFLTRLGADARVSWAIAGAWFTMVKLQGGMNLHTPRVFLDNQAVWTVPRASGSLAITVGYQF